MDPISYRMNVHAVAIYRCYDSICAKLFLLLLLEIELFHKTFEIIGVIQFIPLE